MSKIIPIDENARIELIPQNYVLQYKGKTKKGAIAWRTDGYFPDLVSLATEYINNAPARTMQAIDDLSSLIKIVKDARTIISKIQTK